MMKKLANVLIAGILVSWQWTTAPGFSDPTGFKVALGTSPGVYSQTIDVPGTAARTLTVPTWDASRVSYAVVFAYNQWGQTSPSSEVVFGGAPGAPGARPTLVVITPGG